MQSNTQEKFMVRTIRNVDGSYVYENTLAEGRPEAVRQAERIGEIDRVDHGYIRMFLEGWNLDHGSLEVLAHTDRGSNAATIYQIG